MYMCTCVHVSQVTENKLLSAQIHLGLHTPPLLPLIPSPPFPLSPSLPTTVHYLATFQKRQPYLLCIHVCNNTDKSVVCM